jgi:hypothetical protein
MEGRQCRIGQIAREQVLYSPRNLGFFIGK